MTVEKQKSLSAVCVHCLTTVNIEVSDHMKKYEDLLGNQKAPEIEVEDAFLVTWKTCNLHLIFQYGTHIYQHVVVSSFHLNSQTKITQSSFSFGNKPPT